MIFTAIDFETATGKHHIMDDTKNSGPIVPPMQSNPNLKDYYCPHCSRFLFKGNVKKLNMVCHHCQKLITADGNDLMKSENE